MVLALQDAFTRENSRRGDDEVKRLPMLLSRDAQILIHPLCNPTSKSEIRLDDTTEKDDGGSHKRSVPPGG